jgi:hypothetical protein
VEESKKEKIMKELLQIEVAMIVQKDFISYLKKDHSPRVTNKILRQAGRQSEILVEWSDKLNQVRSQIKKELK